MTRVALDPETVRRQNDLFDLYNNWPGGGDPDDDPEFVAQAREIMGLPPLAEEVSAAAGHDITPGNDQLHHYWTRDPEGLARWATSPHPWTTLVALLTPHVGPEKAKVFASKWHKEVFGIWVGEKKGRNKFGPG